MRWLAEKQSLSSCSPGTKHKYNSYPSVAITETISLIQGKVKRWLDTEDIQLFPSVQERVSPALSHRYLIMNEWCNDSHAVSIACMGCPPACHRWAHPSSRLRCVLPFLWSSKSFTLPQPANHLFIKINLLHGICTKNSHVCCGLCW